MGPPNPDQLLRDRRTDPSARPSAADLGFPSPASDDISLLSPGLDRALSASRTPAVAWSHRLANQTGSASLVPTEPEEVKLQRIQTPGSVYQPAPSLGLDSIVGASIDPVPKDASFPVTSTTATKAGPGLRLPSFDLLGIANPRPDCSEIKLDDPFVEPARQRLLFPEDTFSPSGSNLGGAGSETQDNPFCDSPRAQARVINSPLHQYVTTLTPPDDSGRLVWESFAKLSTGAMESPATDPGNAPTASEEHPAVAGSSAEPSIRIDPPPLVIAEKDEWLRGAIDEMLANLRTALPASNPLKILSHALPCPSPAGHAFPTVIGSLHSQTPSSPTCWINVFHALPGRFNLSDLPTSPPSTPGPPIGGEDYFTSKIFDSAVPITDYQESVTTMPRSPHPIVPPSTVNVSIVERYIPPTSSNEFSEMFSMSGPSVLIDRLVELSPNNGSLIFIYPTRKGAEIFMNEYLGPVLDPLLRAMVIVNGLGADFSASLGRMTAVDTMPTHDTLHRKIRNLCHDLSNHNGAMAKLHSRQAKFELTYASKEEVMLDRKIWASEWWVKQEKPRVRETVSKYFRNAKRLPGNTDITPTSLIHEVLDGVSSKPYGPGREPKRGIEVSVFVITRSA